MTSEAPRRLHVAAVGAEALSGLRQMALPLLVVGVIGTGLSPMLVVYGLLGLVASVVFAFVEWSTTRWTLGAGEIRLRRGWLSEKVVTIPIDRVQAVDTVRGPVQRLFGVVALHVQAAGGGREGEIVLKAVSHTEAEELREAVRERGADDAAPRFTGEASEAPASPADGPAWHLGTRRLLAAAVTSGSLGVLLPVVAGASQVADDVLGFEDAERLLPDTVSEALVILGAVLVVAWVLSFLGTIVAFAGFTAVRDGERLRITRGVVERREASVPVARVHAVQVIESPLREPFGLAAVRIETAGYGSEAATAQTLLPLVRRAEAAAVLRRLLPEHDVPLDAVEPVPPRAARRYMLRPAALGAVAAAALVVAFGTAALAALALVPAGIAAGYGRYRVAGVSRHGHHVVLRRRGRGFARMTAAADARRLQSVRTSASPFQRRGRLATLAVDVSSGRRLSVAHVDGAVADTHLGALAAQATAPPPR